MFGSLFKKNKPRLHLQQQPGTRVLLLPDIFKNNELTNQVFSIEERSNLIKLFEKRNVAYQNYGFSEKEPIIGTHILNMSEKFYSKENDLNQIAGDVREFEFFAKKN